MRRQHRWPFRLTSAPPPIRKQARPMLRRRQGNLRPCPARPGLRRYGRPDHRHIRIRPRNRRCHGSPKRMRWRPRVTPCDFRPRLRMSRRRRQPPPQPLILRRPQWRLFRAHPERLAGCSVNPCRNQCRSVPPSPRKRCRCQQHPRHHHEPSRKRCSRPIPLSPTHAGASNS
jgi:hypothetical protein